MEHDVALLMEEQNENETVTEDENGIQWIAIQDVMRSLFWKIQSLQTT